MQVTPYVFVLNDFIPLSALMPFLLLLKAYCFICMTWFVCETLVPVLHLVLKGNAVSLAFPHSFYCVYVQAGIPCWDE